MMTHLYRRLGVPASPEPAPAAFTLGIRFIFGRFGRTDVFAKPLSDSSEIFESRASEPGPRIRLGEIEDRGGQRLARVFVNFWSVLWRHLPERK